ncbi:MAG: hypothetical protein OHK0046_10980 [Anaerolineae bacterium]
MPTTITPDHRAIAEYHERLNEAREGKDTRHEGNIRHAFATLLQATAHESKWKLVQEHSVRVEGGGHLIRYDGVLRDDSGLPHGYWEAKDSRDDLDKEIEAKRDRRYSFENTIFEDSREAVLYQRGERVLRVPVDNAEKLARLLTQFYNHEIKPFENFNAALAYFKENIPNHAVFLKEKIEQGHKENRDFQKAFAAFMELCRTALNPNIRQEAVDEMLIQHLLTERLIRRIFQVESFAQRNVIAAEIEKVIAALSIRHFNRAEFLGRLDYVYNVIEDAANQLTTFADKQAFLNTVYERFFQGYSVKVADTHGIVYTPQEIVDFMCAAVEEVLLDEFGLHLGDPEVKIIDPATGTGNFIVNLLNRVAMRDIETFYREQLFANEVMLMPYYIASLNIEHAYYMRTGRYQAFEGISFVDTLDLAEKFQQPSLGLFNAENTRRVEEQKKAKINVIIGNPPYNVGQLNENDNNKNRTYGIIDKRVAETYAKDSRATLSTKLYDAYVKFFRWATDRLDGRDGVVCYVTNNSFVDQISFDGMRKHLMQDFTRVYHLDLHGNVRQNPKLSGTTHNVFGIQVGVGITVAVRSDKHTDKQLFYHRVPEFWTAAEKNAFLADHVERMGTRNSLNTINWQELNPNDAYTWLIPAFSSEFETFIPINDKSMRSSSGKGIESIFETYSLGVSTNRDSTVYQFASNQLTIGMERFIDSYNADIDRYSRLNSKPKDVDNFVSYQIVKWSRNLKRHLTNLDRLDFNPQDIRLAYYRPFSPRYLYFSDIAIDELGQFPYYFPTEATQTENRAICVTDKGSEKPFMTMMTAGIADLHIVGAGSSAQCFPFYVYDADGSNRRENITDWALGQFRAQYGDETITKWDIFYYVYGLLHHPVYRERYADNLKKDLPRLPFAPDFRAFSTAGEKLATLHLAYETGKRYRLTWEIAKDGTGQDKPIDYRVTKMQLKDKVNTDAPYSVYARLKVNDTLTLSGLPPEAFAYRLGNRSALEWVVDQYQVKTDKRSGITSDPNTYSDDERYIVELVERVVQVSVETVAIVNGLAAHSLAESALGVGAGSTDGAV